MQVTVGLHLVPAAATVIALAWLGRVPGPAEPAGGAVALAGVLLASGSHVPAGGRPRATESTGATESYETIATGDLV